MIQDAHENANNAHPPTYTQSSLHLTSRPNIPPAPILFPAPQQIILSNDSGHIAIRTRTVLLSIAVRRTACCSYTRWLPDANAVVVARGGEDGGVRGVPCDAVDAADVGFEVLDVLAAGAPDVDSGVCRHTSVYGTLK